MSNHIAVTSAPANPIANPIPVPLAAPSWSTRTFTSDGYVMHEGQWLDAFQGWTAVEDIKVTVRLVGADELVLREDGSIVLDRETEVQFKIGDQVVFVKPADLAPLINTLAQVRRDAA